MSCEEPKSTTEEVIARAEKALRETERLQRTKK
jgi:hypothetical protein